MAISPAAAFDSIAASYDEIFSNSLIGRAQRNAVWRELDKTFCSGQRILEINCGTGEDAVHLAKRGVHVVALDASWSMVAAARRRIAREGLQRRVLSEVMPIEELELLDERADFDGAFSNFSGLNCVDDLGGVARQLGRLLKPHAPLLLCVFGRLCAWEMVWYLRHRNLKKSFRRMQRVVETQPGQGPMLPVHYHSLRSIREDFGLYFTFERKLGIGVAVPPSYMEEVACQFPGALATAARVDNVLARLPVWRDLADHQLLIFRRRKA